MSKSKEVATQSAAPKGLALVAEPDASLEAAAKARAGQGTSQAAEDNLVPFIYVLQAMSPQCKPRNEKYIEGAKEGVFYLTDTKKIAEKLIFVPVAMQKKVNEWIPRDDGGGFVRSHDVMPVDAKPHPKKDRMMVTADGTHDLIETRYHFGLVQDPDSGELRPAVITLKGSGHAVSKNWMVQMNQRKIAGVIAPSWFTAYELTTAGRSNSQGEWSVIQTKPLGWVPAEVRASGESLYDMIAAGEKTVDHAAAGGDDESEKGDAAPI